MWLVQAATFAGSVGLVSLPVLVKTDCSEKNIICGVASYGKYLRTADIHDHVTCVLEHLCDEFGEAFLDLCVYLVKTGCVFVVVDFAKYAGIALGCVALDQTLRLIGIIRSEKPIYEVNCKAHVGTAAISHDNVGRRQNESRKPDEVAVEDDAQEEEREGVDAVPGTISTSMTSVTTWKEVTKERLENEPMAGEGHDPETNEREVNILAADETWMDHEQQPCTDQGMDGLRKCENTGELPKGLLLVIDASHLASSVTVENTLTDIFLKKLKVVDLQKGQHVPVELIRKLEDHVSSQACTETGFASQMSTNYDADISDQETPMNPNQEQPSRVSESDHPLLHSSDPVLVPRCSTSSNKYGAVNKRMKTYRQSHAKPNVYHLAGTYSSLKRLHRSRASDTNQTWSDTTDSELNEDGSLTDISSEEIIGQRIIDSSVCNQSKYTESLTLNREELPLKSCTSNNTHEYENGEEVFDASSYVLSSKSLSSSGLPHDASQTFCQIPASNPDNVEHQEALNALIHSNTPQHPGMQQILFKQFPLLRPSPIDLLAYPFRYFPYTQCAGSSVPSQPSQGGNLQQARKHRPHQLANESLGNLRAYNLKDDIRIKSESSRHGTESLCQYVDEKSALSKIPHCEGTSWRVLFIHVACWILFGRHWRRFF